MARRQPVEEGCGEKISLASAAPVDGHTSSAETAAHERFVEFRVTAVAAAVKSETVTGLLPQRISAPSRSDTLGTVRRRHR